mgnify:CR=1 FL=1
MKIENIEWGNYYIKEKEPLSGYKKIDTKFEFTVNRETFLNGNKVIVSVQNSDTKEQISIIKNERKQGKVILTKYSCNASGEETENTLEGAKFELYKSNGELVGEYTTDGNGQIVVENLDWDSYYFQEKEAPEGYKLNPEKMNFEIKENGEVIKCNMKDELIVQVPNTEKKEFPTFELITMILCAIGFGVMLYVKKNKRK